MRMSALAAEYVFLVGIQVACFALVLLALKLGGKD